MFHVGLSSPENTGTPSVAALLAVATIVAFALLIVAGLSWRLAGGIWAVVETPSMGRAAPVGTFILIRPRPISAIHVGDIVTYRPRNNPTEMISHRVVRNLADNTRVVRGDINGSPDPFPVRAVDLVGTVAHRWFGVGWLIRALPYLVIPVMVLMAITGRYVRPRWRSTVRILAVCLIFSVAALILRPFVHPILIAVIPGSGLQGQASIVSGGLLPTRVTGVQNRFVDLVAGQTGVVPVQSPTAGAPFWVVGTPHLEGIWLMLVIVVCAAPMLWCLIVGLAPVENDA